MANVYAGLQLHDWDILFVTGVLAFVVAVEMEDRLLNTFERQSRVVLIVAY